MSVTLSSSRAQGRSQLAPVRMLRAAIPVLRLLLVALLTAIGLVALASGARAQTIATPPTGASVEQPVVPEADGWVRSLGPSMRGVVNTSILERESGTGRIGDRRVSDR